MGAFRFKTIDQDDLERVLELFPRLKERFKQQAGTLSGGEQQMLAIGRALMGKPRLLLLDEPSMGLAPLIVAQIFEIIREINTAGVTVLLVEQNAAQALALADRGYVLETGEIVLEGTGPGAARRRPDPGRLPGRGDRGIVATPVVIATRAGTASCHETDPRLSAAGRTLYGCACSHLVGGGQRIEEARWCRANVRVRPADPGDVAALVELVQSVDTDHRHVQRPAAAGHEHRAPARAVRRDHRRAATARCWSPSTTPAARRRPARRPRATTSARST